MSWNVSTRLNNLQQQINNLVNKGLTNPLEQIMDANGFTIKNINILDGGSNAIQMKSANVNGIQMDANLDVDANITCNTLNYTSLNPPINTNGISFQIIGQNVVETTAGNFSLTEFNPYNGIITTTKILNPTATMSINFSSPNGSNSIAIGFSSVNNLYPSGGFRGVQNGIFWYPFENFINQITNGTQTSNSYAYTNQTDLTLEMEIIDGTLKIYVNNTEATILEQPLSGLYYFTITSYVGSTASINNLIVGPSYGETLEEVLSNGNNAGNQNITGVNEFTCNTLNYTTLNPPITESQNLESVLTAGNNAGNKSITGLNDLNTQTIACNSTLNAKAYLQIGNSVGQLSNLQFCYQDGTPQGNNFALVGYNDTMLLQQYKNSTLYNQAINVNDKTYIQFKTGNIIYTQDGTNNGLILDSLYYTPLYKQFYNNVNGIASSSPSTPSNVFLFSIPVYPSASNTSYNYGLNNVDVTFTNLQLTFSTLSATSPAPNFSISQTATLYLTDTQATLNPSTSNSIVVKMVSPTGSATNSVVFNSTIPIILWNSTATNKTKVYLNVLIAGIPQVGVSNYQVSMASTNFMVNSYISKSQGGSITFGQ